MKHNQKHDNVRNTALQLVPVHFEYTNPTAVSVCIAGTFNHWQPEAKALHSSGLGKWCLVVDGKWIPDPAARETVPNPYGGKNSILKVAASPEAAHLADAEEVPLKIESNKK